MKALAAPFPWQALDRVPREVVRGLADVRRAAASAVSTAAVGAALASVTGQSAEIVVLSTDLVAVDPPSLGGVVVALTNAQGTLALSVEVDRDLALLLVSSVLGRPAGLADPTGVIDTAVHGAVAAIVAFVARRAHGSVEALRPRGPGGLSLAPGERRIRVEATVLLGGQAFAARLIASASPLAGSAQRNDADLLAALGTTRISLPVVAAASAARRDELAALAPGDVWLPGDGWMVRGSPPTGTVRIAPPLAEQAIFAKLGDDGRIVIGGVEPWPIEEVEGAMSGTSDDSKHERDETGAAGGGDDGIAATVLDAPVVVRVEIGTVTMTAREWAAIGPGDVVALGRGLGEPAILRVAGIEVARGELVDVDGELGVRIRASEQGKRG